MRFRLSLRVQFYLLMIAGFSGATLATFSPILLIVLAASLTLQPLSHFIKHPKMRIFYRTGVRETLLLVMAYLLLSLAWGLDAKLAFIAWLKLFAIFVGGCFVFESMHQFNHRQKQALADAFICGMAIVTVIVAMHLKFGNLISIQLLPSAVPMGGAMEFGSYYLCLLVWPCLTYFLMKGRMGMAVAVALMLIMILMKMDHPPAMIAVIVGSIFLALSFYTPKLAVTAFLLLWTSVVVLVPVYTANMDADHLIETYQEDLSPEWQNRAHIWEITAKHALKEDPNGAGFNSAGNVKLAKKETLPFDDEAQTIPYPVNGILQLWLELGLVGLFGVWLLVVVMFFVFRNMVPSAQLCKVAATAQLATLVVLPLFFSNVWNIPFLVIAMLSLLVLHICINAAARNVI